MLLDDSFLDCCHRGASYTSPSGFNSIDIHRDGQCVFATSDVSLFLFDAIAGTKVQEMNMCTEQYPRHVSHVLATGEPSEVLCSIAMDGLFSVGHVDMMQRELIRSFGGHGSPVKSISMSRNSRLLTTSSDDGVVRFWDFRASDVAVGRISTSGPAVAAHDLQGRICAISVDRTCIGLYDLVNPAKGPYVSYKVSEPVQALRFSPSGRYLMVIGNSGYLSIMDLDKNGSVLATRSGVSDAPQFFEAAFSPDEQFLLACTDTGLDWLNPLLVSVCEDRGPLHYNRVKFSPRYGMFVAAKDGIDGSLDMWVPADRLILEEDQDNFSEEEIPSFGFDDSEEPSQAVSGAPTMEAVPTDSSISE